MKSECEIQWLPAIISAGNVLQLISENLEFSS